MQRLFPLSALVKDPGQRQGGVDTARFEIKSLAQRSLVAVLGEELGLRRDQRVEESADRGCRLRADELRDDPPIAERLHRGYALDAARRRDGGIRVDIELDQLDCTLALVDLALQDRLEHQAGRAP